VKYRRVYVDVVSDVQVLAPEGDHSNRYPDTEQLPVAVAEVTADHVILIEVGFIAFDGTLGRVIAAGTVGVRIVNVADQGPVPAWFYA